MASAQKVHLGNRRIPRFQEALKIKKYGKNNQSYGTFFALNGQDTRH
jgi:hypothetical protein